MAEPARRHAHHGRRWLIAAAIVVGLLVAGRLLLNPLAAAGTRRALGGMTGFTGDFRDVSVRLRDLSYTITNLKLSRDSDDRGQPLFFAELVRVRLHGSNLLRGRLVASVELLHPKLVVVKTERPQPLPNVRAKLERLPRMRVERVALKEGELLWVDGTDPRKPQLWIHGVQATVENVGTRSALLEGEPTLLTLSGTLQRTGKLSVLASADPLARRPTFAGSARVSGLSLYELGDFLSSKAGVTPEHGSIDMSARFESKEGHITGGLKPVVKNPSLKPAAPGLFEKLKTALVDTALKLFSDRVPGRNAVATTIPIRGDISQPNAQTWPTILSILRNAFVEGLQNGFSNIPPQSSQGTSQR